jgi:hypothetical protein
MSSVRLLPVGSAAKALATSGLEKRATSPNEAAQFFLRAAERSVCSVGSAVYLAYAANCFEKAEEYERSARVSETACSTSAKLGPAAAELVSSVLRGTNPLTH